MGWQRFSPLSLLPDCTYVPMRSLRWNDAEIDPSAIDEIAGVCRTHAIDKVMPVDFPTVLLLSRYGDAISGTSVAAVPQADTMLALHNRWQFSRAIERMGLPQPRTRLARCRADLLSTRLAFPIITKPVVDWARAGFRIHNDAAALARVLDSGTLGADFPLLVQEYSPGRDVGFAFLARHGQLVAHIAFEETRRGARRCYDAPVLHQHVAKLVAATGYHGIGEVDARYDPERDEYRLLEVNPRFWASLLYAERAGVNFPELLVHLDDLDDDLGVVAEPDEVRLSAYEVMVAKSLQLTERAHHTVSKVCARVGLISRHQGAACSSCAGLLGKPKRGKSKRVPRSAASPNSVSAGSSQSCSARLNVPQVHWQEQLAAQHLVRDLRVLRPKMDVAPGRMERADLEHHQIERAVARADLLELWEEAGVAAEKQPLALGLDHPRRPQRGVAIRQRTTREVLRGRRGEPHAGQAQLFVPVELVNAFGRYAAGLEPCAHTERGHERNFTRRELDDARVTQVIVVVVG